MSAVALDDLTREEAETLAARVLRAAAGQAFKHHRNVATATREASQLTHLAIRLEAFAAASPVPAEKESR